ncbi:MAG: hypothetical protein P8Y60_02130, partial [Calditrichota bacterium]
MKISEVIFLFLSLAFFISLLLPQDGETIPAFARRYKISCTTCHAPIPKLKPYGEEFASNGFVIPKEEKERDYVTAGDNLLWLNRTFPIAVRFDAYAVYEQDREVDKDIETPWGVKLLSGGPLYHNIGYYFYFYLSERGEVAGIEDAYVQFNKVLGSNLAIMVGQFQTSDPLMKRELRLTFEDYQIYKTKIGESGIDLTYDRGLMFGYGVEQTGTDLVAMVVNGNGKGEADSLGKFDNDNFKNFGFRIKQGIGGIASLGGFVYYGQERYTGETEKNKVTYLGPDLNFTLGKLEFTGQYLHRKDTHPLPGAHDVETNGIVAELILAPQKDKSRFYLIGLYNYVDSDLDFDDYESATLSGTYLVARN